MGIKQRLVMYLIGAVLVVPFLAAMLPAQSALAYKCTGQTNNQQHYYKDGACYQPVGNTCLDNPPPANSENCQNRDTSKDTKIANEKPVKNDGTEVTEWQCSTGTYNATKHACETCNAFGNCQTNSTVPAPKGDDKTVDPDQNNGENSEEDNSDATKTSGEGECAGEKTDFFACDADGAGAVVGILRIIILIVSVGVGVVAVGGIVYGAMLYASAQDNQEQVQRSIKVIRNVIVGLLLYIFMVTIINFLVPGGVFGGAEPEEQNQSETENTGENNQNQNNQNSNNNNNNSNNANN